MRERITIILILAGLAFLISILYHTVRTTPAGPIPHSPTPVVSVSPAISRPTDEQAELTGFGFVQSIIQSSASPSAHKTAYEALSKKAKEKVSPVNNLSGLLQFLLVSEVPESASVEDLRIENSVAILIVGINFPQSPRALRGIQMIVEDGKWKIDRIEEVLNFPN